MDWGITLALGKLDESSALCVWFCAKFTVRPGNRLSPNRELGDLKRSGTVANQFDDDITNSISALDVRDLCIRARK